LFSADIVITFYKKIPSDLTAQKNLSTIGFSSGKTVFALRSGPPAIIDRGEGFPELIEQLGSVVVETKFKEIDKATLKIKQSYDVYSQAALKMFDTHLDFRTSLLAVIKRLDKLD
jgi:hypothetical protein